MPPRARATPTAASSSRSNTSRSLSGPPIVVFQDLDDPPAAAVFGEVMCTTYQAFGAVGLITSGAGRDLDQVRAIDFPVFTNGTICSHGYNHIPQVHVPVRVGGLVVFPDDLLHADRNGVTNIPPDIAAEVADIGDEFVAAEAVVLEAMRRGTPDAGTINRSARRDGRPRPPALGACQPRRQNRLRNHPHAKQQSFPAEWPAARHVHPTPRRRQPEPRRGRADGRTPHP